MAEAKKDEAANPEAAGKEPSKHFQWFTLVIVPLLGVVLGGVLTYVFTQYANRLRAFQYVVSSSSAMFQKPQMGDQQIRVFYGEKQIDNVSSVSVLLFNRTDQDFEDVPVTVTIKATGGGPPVVLHSKVDGALDSPSAPPTQPSTLVPQTQSSRASTSVSYQYKLRVANRSDSPVLLAEYLIEGKDAPEVSVRLTKKGLDAERGTLNADTFNKRPDWAVWMLLAGFAVLGFTVAHILHQKERRENQLAIQEAYAVVKLIKARKAMRGHRPPDDPLAGRISE